MNSSILVAGIWLALLAGCGGTDGADAAPMGVQEAAPIRLDGPVGRPSLVGTTADEAGARGWCRESSSVDRGLEPSTPEGSCRGLDGALEDPVLLAEAGDRLTWHTFRATCPEGSYRLKLIERPTDLDPNPVSASVVWQREGQTVLEGNQRAWLAGDGRLVVPCGTDGFRPGSNVRVALGYESGGSPMMWESYDADCSAPDGVVAEGVDPDVDAAVFSHADGASTGTAGRSGSYVSRDGVLRVECGMLGDTPAAQVMLGYKI